MYLVLRPISNPLQVSIGTPLCILSAMKMETVVAAPLEGVVKRITIKVGDNLKPGDLLVEIV